MMQNKYQHFLAGLVVLLSVVGLASPPTYAANERLIPTKKIKSTPPLRPCSKSVHPSKHFDRINLQTARNLIERWLPCEQVKQFTLKALNPSHYPHETFIIKAGSGQHIIIAGSSTSALLMGWNWYMKYVAHASITLTGVQLNLPHTLPLPDHKIRHHANVENRYALNDTDAAYTQPYAGWEYWERKIDILAMHGINQVLVYVGQAAVYYKTFQKFGYSKKQLRNWIPLPAHQPWWLLQNLCCFPHPLFKSVMQKRVALGQKIAHRLRALGMTPVFPGYYGTVPSNFAQKNPGAHVIDQGMWVGGFERPDWLDPTGAYFPKVAQTFYRIQERLFGPSTMYKMDLLHEGGQPGNVDIGKASKAVQQALLKAHPGATWVILGWQSNPRKATLRAVDRSKMLILDGLSDRYSGLNREKAWLNTPYAFGSIWNFGGHTTMGANISVWNRKYWKWLNKPGSKLSGIAIMPEASDNNPVAWDFMTEMAWRNGPVDLDRWFAQWATRRYGGADPHAKAAWHYLMKTAYSMPDNGWSEAQSGLFGARPSLTVQSAAAWSPKQMRYDARTFAQALPALLKVAPPLRKSSAYRYDLMDVARQVLSNLSRKLLPEIKQAYQANNIQRFEKLTDRWLHAMELLDRVVGTNKHTLLGAWLEGIKRYALNKAQRKQLRYDAQLLLTVWGGENSALHDYANREWQGLVGDYYYSRWKKYFHSLHTALKTGRPPEPINWYAFGNRWAHQRHHYQTEPSGNIYKIAQEVYHWLQTAFEIPLYF